MRSKVAWLFVWTTLTYWLGCGENQNYRINEDDTPIFEEGYPTEPGSVEAEPSLEGLDRSNWERERIGPASGLVPHFPYYYKREFFDGIWSTTPDRPSPLYRQAVSDRPSVLAATADPRDTIGLREIGDLFLAPTKFAMDTVTLPFRAATVDPPWEIQYSPQELSPKVQ